MPDPVCAGQQADLQQEVARLRELLEAATLREAMTREAAETEHARLTFELGHRVKNTLSVVQALASQTMRGAATKEEGLEVFGARVMALARANDAILKDSWTTATIRSVADSILHAFDPAHLRLAIDGPDIRIEASAALAFGMALQELASNARRFGALSAETGQVTLEWTMMRSAPDEGLHLIWAEAGGPPVAPPARRGFGLRLIEQSLKSAFGRDVAIEFPPEGLVCRVLAPLSRVAA